jgi:hypothetical protein
MDGANGKVIEMFEIEMLEGYVSKSAHTTLAHSQFTPACIMATVEMSNVRISCGLI